MWLSAYSLRRVTSSFLISIKLECFYRRLNPVSSYSFFNAAHFRPVLFSLKITWNLFVHLCLSPCLSEPEQTCLCLSETVIPSGLSSSSSGNGVLATGSKATTTSAAAACQHQQCRVYSFDLCSTDKNRSNMNDFFLSHIFMFVLRLDSYLPTMIHELLSTFWLDRCQIHLLVAPYAPWEGASHPYPKKETSTWG